MRRRVAQLAGLLLLPIAAWPTTRADDTLFAVGRPFPELRLPDADTGRPSSIANYRGSKLVLQVFASW